jgi:L-seryl-tRNA(Ser) seleniumtransferase
LREFYDPYQKYGLRRVVNAATSMTTLGGSISPPEVFEAMENASKSFVYIPELQQWAGRHIADATGAEAGLPTAGASNGLMLAAAACIMKGTELENYDPLEGRGWSHLSMRLPMHTEGLRTEFVVQRCCRNVYDYAVECAGGRFVEVGDDGCATIGDLEGAFDPGKTAAFYFTAREARKGLPLEDVVEVAHRNGAPVIVDAAAEIPPRRKLTMYIERGADLVSYSGGKHLAGPNNSGLLAGRADLIKLAHLQAYPFNGVGRAAKMSRETIVGLVVALKSYLEHDEEAAFEAWEGKAEWMAEELGSIPGVEAGIVYQKVVEDSEPMAPFCYLVLDEEACGFSGSELVAKLKDGSPRIWTLWEPGFLLGEGYEGKMCINPQYMLDGEEEIVVGRIRGLLKP